MELSPQKKAWITIRKNRKENPYKIRAKKSWATRKKSKRYTTKEKQEQRKKYLKLVDYFIEPNILVLETPNLLFVNQLNLKDVGRVDIPNNEEFNLFKKLPKKVNLYNKSYYQFVKEYKKRHPYSEKINCYDLIWADYCGTFTRFKKDIELTFKKRLFHNYAFYGLTLCMRDINKNKEKEMKNKDLILFINEFISRIGQKHHYFTRLSSESGIYKRNMVNLIFEIMELPSFWHGTHKLSKSKEYIQRVREGVKKAIERNKYKHPCIICGKEYLASGLNAKYCSNECRKVRLREYMKKRYTKLKKKKEYQRKYQEGYRKRGYFKDYYKKNKKEIQLK